MRLASYWLLHTAYVIYMRILTPVKRHSPLR
ncbi:hypothetical protein KL86PLE_100248 [uncultured Pleomorphomonas sp.]|uniref:Uncharacterized protein n=1 Tax=uncultured Pleomorphomonas sp. TaxID=442121 RepID=A0A212L1V6_9HYPH|nr:hypothetical protein KL86PLE_100248 [uncultured Pleomorphomonas sp.]